MPIYVVGCNKCGKHQDIYRSIEQRNQDLPECCGEKTERKIVPTLAYGDIQPYVSMIDGSIINSRSQHRTHLRDHNCIEIGNETKHLKATQVGSPAGLKETLIRETKRRLGRE
jgi:hypothetical protein